MLTTTSVEPFQKDWRYNHAQKEGKLESSFCDWMIAPGKRPSSHEPDENGEAESNIPWRGFHALTLSRGTSIVPKSPCQTRVPIHVRLSTSLRNAQQR